MRSEAKPSIIAPRYEHGTRACYASGCRCDDCRAANRDHYRERMARMRELAAEVRPTGPGIPSTMRRAGRTISILRCAGANGAACVVDGGAWLKGKLVCGRCVERATVWDGPVPARRVRRHLLQLRRAGVGYKAVASACDVAASTLFGVLSGEPLVRASTERKVLAVDAGARADGALVDGAKTKTLVAKMRALGFTLGHLAELLGYAGNSPQIDRGTRVTAATAARVAKLWRRIERGEVTPRRVLVVATEERAWLDALVARGVPAKTLSRRLGFQIAPGSTARMMPSSVEAVRAFREAFEAMTIAERQAEWPRYVPAPQSAPGVRRGAFA